MRNHEIEAYWLPIFQSYYSGTTALPLHLGLSEERFDTLMHLAELEPAPVSSDIVGAVTMRSELLSLRIAELTQIEELLIEALNPDLNFGEDMVRVLASACLGSQHLWHDLGMPERPRLTQLFKDYFPSLHAKNVNNMRWKRFLYRQLCETGGDYVCRSPSCEQCTSYTECFDIKE